MIKTITMKNFRGIESRTVQFGPAGNRIEGPNEIGKSTIDEAIAFTYYGCDAGGGKNPDHLIQNGKDSTSVSLTTDKATLLRSKRRGATSVVDLQREGFPAIRMNQTELTKLLGYDYDMFGSAYRSGYFMTLTPDARVRVINEVVKVDRKSVLERILTGVTIPWGLIKLLNTKVDADAVARERRKTQNELSAAQGAIKELEAVLSNPGTSVTPEESQALDEQFRVSQAKCDTYSAYEVAARDYRTAQSRYEHGLNAFKLDVKKAEQLRRDLAILGKRPELDFEAAQADLNKTGLEINEVRSQTKPLPQAPVVRDSLTDPSCPRCGQLVSEKLKASILEENNANVIAFNKLEREVADHNQTITETLNFLVGKQNAQRDRISQTKEAQVKWDSESAGIKKQLETLPKEGMEPPVGPGAPIPPWPLEEAEQNVVVNMELRGKIEGVKLFMNKNAGTHQKMVELNQQAGSLTEKIKALTVVEEALKKMPELELQETKALLSLPGVELVFDGAQIDCAVKGVPYRSLSSGRKMKTDLLWCRAIQKLLVNAPKFYFCDDADLVDSFQDYIPPESQIFFASVRPELTELQVVQL